MMDDPNFEAAIGAMAMLGEAMSKPRYVEPSWIGSIISDLRQKGRTNDELKELGEAILDEAENEGDERNHED